MFTKPHQTFALLLIAILTVPGTVADPIDDSVDPIEELIFEQVLPLVEELAEELPGVIPYEDVRAIAEALAECAAVGQSSSDGTTHFVPSIIVDPYSKEIQGAGVVVVQTGEDSFTGVYWYATIPLSLTSINCR